MRRGDKATERPTGRIRKLDKARKIMYERTIKILTRSKL